MTVKRTVQRIFAAALTACLLVASSCASDDEPNDAAQHDAGQTDAGQNDAGLTGDALCDSIVTEADELVRAAQSCEQDDDCEIVGLTVPCLILCSSVVNRDADVDALQAEATRLSDDYLEHCAMRNGYGCAIADCGDPSGLRGECTDGQCATAPRSSQP